MRPSRSILLTYLAGTAGGVAAYTVPARFHHPTLGAAAAVGVMLSAALYAERFWP